MLAQVKSGFSAGSVSRGPPAPTFVGSSTVNNSADISMPGGIASTDLAVLIDWGLDSDPTPPADTLPFGWTRIGTTQTDSGGSLLNGSRLNVCYKVLDGTETTITGMATGGVWGARKVLLVFRKAASLTWGSPADVEAEVNNDGGTTKTITVGAAPLIVIGYVGISSGTDLPMSPAETATVSVSSNGSLNVGYIIYGSSPANNTIDPASVGNAYVIGGFYIPLT